MTTINQSLEKALGLHRRGQHSEAETLYRKVLAIQSDHPEALYYLGVLALQMGKPKAALQLIDRSLAVNTNFPQGHYDRANTLMALERFEDAVTSFDRALEIKPRFAAAQNNKGNALLSLNDHDGAIEAFDEALKLDPSLAWTIYNKGRAYFQSSRTDEALKCFDDALALDESLAAVYSEKGSVYLSVGESESAISCIKRALEIDVDNIDYLINLAAAYQESRQFEKSTEVLNKVIALQPHSADAYYNMGILQKAQGLLTDAIASYEKVLSFDADYHKALFNLGNSLTDAWEVDGAVDCFRRAVTADPSYQKAWHNLLFISLYQDNQSEKSLFEERSEWGKRLADNDHRPTFGNDRDPDRRLRIGYVSPDFRRHSCAYFIEPLFEAHNLRDVEVFAYANVIHCDSVTERLRGKVDAWRDITGLTKADIISLIGEDGIDILVDLEGHSGNSQLELFAARPAPVQLSWLGYPATTGLDQIDYRFTDHLADPPGKSDQFHTEKLYRLPDGFHCYRPPEDAPDVGSLPYDDNGFVTFGSYNNILKVTESTIAVWSMVLDSVPNSRLTLKSTQFEFEETRDKLVLEFKKMGVESGRLNLLPHVSWEENPLDLYNQIDIALDTFPYNGTTTTLEALFMGVPVVTLRGDRHAGRVGVSLLNQMNSDELIADNLELYIEIASALAGDIHRLRSYRNDLRSKFYQSSLHNAKAFAANIESAYRNIWQTWCESD